MNVGGRSGLDLLIQTWCENAETFQGFWSTRASSLGLSQLFVSERPSLQGLIVKGDIILKEENKNGESPRFNSSPRKWLSFSPIQSYHDALKDQNRYVSSNEFPVTCFNRDHQLRLSSLRSPST